MNRRALALTLLATVAAPVAVGAAEIGARAAVWLPTLAGEARVGAAGGGSTLDVSEDLGLGEDLDLEERGAPSAEAWVWAGDHHVLAAGTRLTLEATNLLVGESFGGQTFTGATRSTLEVTMVDGLYQYDLLDFENVLAGFSVGPLVQVKFLEGRAELVQGATRAEEPFSLAVPLVGVGAHLGILADLVEARLRAGWIGWKGDSALDVQLEASYNPLPFLEIVVGYRHLALKLDEDDRTLDLTLGGPYAGLGLKF